MNRKRLLSRHEFVANYIESMERERMALGLTQFQMAEKLGVSVSGYKKLISGETGKIDLYVAYRMFRLTGKYISEMCKDENTEISTLRMVQNLSPSQKRFVDGIIDFEIEFRLKSDGKEDEVTMMIPTGCFEDGMVWDSVDLKKVNVSAYRKRYGQDIHCTIMVNSNHLYPVYHKGDILLICQRPPKDGDTGLFINKESGRAYVRKFRQKEPWLLEPINGYGVTFEVDNRNVEEIDKWIVFGVVLTKMRE